MIGGKNDQKKFSQEQTLTLLLSACGDDVTEAPYGTWESPITAELTTESAVGLRSVRLDGDDLYWIESRPEEGGRRAIVKRDANGQCLVMQSRPNIQVARVSMNMVADHTMFGMGSFTFPIIAIRSSIALPRAVNQKH